MTFDVEAARREGDVAIRDGEAWRDRRLPEIGRTLLAACDEIERLRAAVLDYENGITWQTTCTNCAKLMDKNYEQYVRLEVARECLEAEARMTHGEVSRRRIGEALLRVRGES